MEIIIILLLIIISILSIGAKMTFIIIGFVIVGFILWIVIGHIFENGKIEKEEREEKHREYKKKFDTQRAAYLNGEISEEEFEYMPKTETAKRELRALKDKLYCANHPES